MTTEDDKIIELRRVLRSMGGVAVAFSGGTDSSLLLKIASEELGPSVVAMTAKSPSFPKHELDAAREIATSIGVDMIELETSELKLEEYVANGPLRCYHCKKVILSDIVSKAHLFGMDVVIDGNNADDMKVTRQGSKAAAELGVRSPLAEVGLTKMEVREAARLLGLSNWNRPSAACLASRVPYGTRITKELLGRIEKAEEVFRGSGVRQVRVRAHGDIARIEVEPEYFDVVLSERQRIASDLKMLGFRYICLDIEGFRSGSLEL